MRSTTKGIVTRARKLRRTMSPPEAILWTILRRRPGDLKFRRQHPVGPYVLDFYCPCARLGIEVDGAVHERGDNLLRDARRDGWLSTQGIRILRINSEQCRGTARAFCSILSEPALQAPPPRKRGPLPISLTADRED